MINKSFGRRLRAIRESRNLSREKLAEGISVTSTSIYNIERGEQWIGPEVLARLCEHLNLSPAVFFTDDVVKIEPTPEEALEVIAKALAERRRPEALKDALREADDVLEEIEGKPKSKRRGSA